MYLKLNDELNSVIDIEVIETMYSDKAVNIDIYYLSINNMDYAFSYKDKDTCLHDEKILKELLGVKSINEFGKDNKISMWNVRNTGTLTCTPDSNMTTISGLVIKPNGIYKDGKLVLEI